MLLLMLALVMTSSSSNDEPNLSDENNRELMIAHFKNPQGEAVDLGLSVKWSNKNFGASSERDEGALVGWGDPTGLETDQTGIEMKWSILSDGITHKRTVSWNSNKYGGITPPLEISGTELDVVTSHWGNGWRIPSFDEFEELATQCTWTEVSIDGVNYYKVTGPNGNHIILPYNNVVVHNAQKGWDSMSDQPQQLGTFWTSSSLNVLQEKYAWVNFYKKVGLPNYVVELNGLCDAWAWEFYDSNTHINVKYPFFAPQPRCYRMPIRPVKS